MILFVIGQRNSNGIGSSNCSSNVLTGDTARTWELADGGLGGAEGSGGVSTVRGSDSGGFSGRGPEN